MEQTRNILLGFVAAVMAYLSPIKDGLEVISIIFILNFFFGLIAGVQKGESFDFRKAFHCVKNATLFFVLAASTYVVGKMIGNEEGARQCVNYFVYMIVYIYGVNILKNATEISGENSPAYSILKYIHEILSLEISRRFKNYNDISNDKYKK